MTNEYRSLKDHVYNHIVDLIDGGTLADDHKISEQQICDALGVSRTPVREALIQLAADGYLENVPRKGFYVKRVTEDSAREIVEIIGPLDGRAALLAVGDHFYVGQSARTNEEGIRQFCEILEGWGLEGSEVKLEKVLHLKTGVNYLEDGNMLVSGEFVTKPDFEQYNRIEIPEDEAYAANCIWVNGTVIVPEGYPTVLKAVQDAGYETITVDTSEYRKLDGGLSCLSLRF